MRKTRTQRLEKECYEVTLRRQGLKDIEERYKNESDDKKI